MLQKAIELVLQEWTLFRIIGPRCRVWSLWARVKGGVPGRRPIGSSPPKRGSCSGLSTCPLARPSARLPENRAEQHSDLARAVEPKSGGGFPSHPEGNHYGVGPGHARRRLPS